MLALLGRDRADIARFSDWCGRSTTKCTVERHREVCNRGLLRLLCRPLGVIVHVGLVDNFPIYGEKMG